jgi:hypothetical protein
MKPYVILAVAGLTTSFSVRVLAQENEPSLAQQDREQIVAIGKKNDEAWSKSDATALAALFTDDAIFVTPGTTFSGRGAIEKRYQDVFQRLKSKLGSDLSAEGKHITNVTKNIEMHALDNNAVWGVGEWSQMLPGPNGTVKEIHGSYGCVTVRVGDTWKNRMLVVNVAPSTAAGAVTPSPTAPAGNQ